MDTRISTRTGSVESITAKNKGFGSNAELVGAELYVKSSDQADTTWTDRIQIPLGWMPDGLKVGDTIRVTVELAPEPSFGANAADGEGELE